MRAESSCVFFYKVSKHLAIWSRIWCRIWSRIWSAYDQYLPSVPPLIGPYGCRNRGSNAYFCFFWKRMIKHISIWRFAWVLDILWSSKRLVGFTCTYPDKSSTSRCWVMAPKPPGGSLTVFYTNRHNRSPIETSLHEKQIHWSDGQACYEAILSFSKKFALALFLSGATERRSNCNPLVKWHDAMPLVEGTYHRDRLKRRKLLHLLLHECWRDLVGFQTCVGLSNAKDRLSIRPHVMLIHV